jgi:hypothetical protein
MEYYASLPIDRKRFIIAWTPVILSITEGFSEYPLDAFVRHIPYFYNCFTSLLRVPISFEQQISLQRIFERVGTSYKIGMDVPVWEYNTTTSFSDLHANASPDTFHDVIEAIDDEFSGPDTITDEPVINEIEDPDGC